jgi:hypothetical protein
LNPEKRLLEIARVLVRLDHVASLSINANHSVMWPTAELRVTDCVWLAVPQATEWERIGNEIKAALVFARADFVTVFQGSGGGNMARLMSAVVGTSLLVAIESARPPVHSTIRDVSPCASAAVRLAWQRKLDQI